MNTRKMPDCRKCKFFQITWDPQKPYGCTAIGFKGKVMPSIIVRKTSGQRCLLFQPKKIKSKENGND